MRSTSLRSARPSSRQAFPSSTATKGSMNTVAPLLEMSWINPWTCPRISAFTARTYRPPRVVMKGS